MQALWLVIKMQFSSTSDIKYLTLAETNLGVGEVNLVMRLLRPSDYGKMNKAPTTNII